MLLLLVLACHPSGTADDPDADHDGYAASLDCDDADPDVHPSADEICDGKDDDCDGTVDVGAVDGTDAFADADGDGFGNPHQPVHGCIGGNASADGTDCDDSRADVFPSADDACGDGTDGDCDGIDPRCPPSGTYASTDADVQFTGTKSGELVGYAIASGDFDGDGQSDLAIAGPKYGDTTNERGRVYLELGPFAPGSYRLVDAAALYTGVGAYDHAGNALALADVDGDGKDELAIGAPGADAAATSAGAVYLVTGSTTPKTATLSTSPTIVLGVAADDAAGTGVALADADGDGQAELLVTAPGAAAAYLVHPTAGTSSLSSAIAWTGAPASSVAWLGDVDGDGVLDAAIGAPGPTGASAGAGQVFVLRSPTSAGSGPLSSADAVVTGLSAELAGTSVAGADVDGDGLADLVVGAPADEDFATTAPGGAYVLLAGHLSGAVSVASADATLTGRKAKDHAGVSVANAGDVDGDGQDDLIVGASQADDATIDGGAAYLVYGPISGAISLASADVDVTGATDNALVGLGVGAAGDLDGDGAVDFAVGACAINDGTIEAGDVDVILGGVR